MGTRVLKKHTKYIMGIFSKKEPFGFVSQIIEFIQPPYIICINWFETNRTSARLVIKCTHV